jgi:hypothetical protein
MRRDDSEVENLNEIDRQRFKKSMSLKIDLTEEGSKWETYGVYFDKAKAFIDSYIPEIRGLRDKAVTEQLGEIAEQKSLIVKTTIERDKKDLKDLENKHSRFDHFLTGFPNCNTLRA